MPDEEEDHQPSCLFILSLSIALWLFILFVIFYAIYVIDP